MKATVTGFASDAVRLIRERLPASAWAVVLLVAIGSVLNGLKPAADKSTNVAFALLGIALFLFTLWTSAVVTRFMAAQPGRRWALDGAFFRFLGVQLVLTVAVAVIAYTANRVAPAASSTTSFAMGFAFVTLLSLIVLPFAPWCAALAIGDRSVGAGESFAAMRGLWVPLAGATLLLVLPVQLLDAVVASTAVKNGSIPIRTGLGVVDGLLKAFTMVVIPWALATAAWRFIKGEAVHDTHLDDEIA